MTWLHRSVFLLCIFYIENVHVLASEEACTVRQTSSDLLETNSTERLLSFAVDEKFKSHSIKEFHDTWKLFGVNTKSDIVRKGREFAEFVKQRFGIDISALTDEQLYQGQLVDLGDVVFSGFVFDDKLRLVTEIMHGVRKVTYYNDTRSMEIGFVLRATRSMASKGQWIGTFLKDAIVSSCNIHLPKSKCDNAEADIIVGTATYPWYVDEDGFTSYEYAVYSNKHGQGILHGIGMKFQAAGVDTVTMKFF
ncbi:unnamed protein product [Owenia fusiformis]|uniref:Uncharacterized protein n=1 Tax=Owenia fusiformis TaxID=6347 RepID=A0A8J1UGN1_OWEFU|nr:unnamed protein product [Owenia fusiformis]